MGQCILFLSGLLSLFLLVLLPSRPVYAELESNTANDTTPQHQCICTFQAPPVIMCTEYDAEFMSSVVTRVRREMANLSAHIDHYGAEWNRADDRIRDFDRQLSSLISTCLIVRKDRLVLSEDDSRNSVGAGGVDHSINMDAEVRKHLLTLEDMLSTVKSAQPDREMLQGINNKMANITKLMSTMTTGMVDLASGGTSWMRKAADLDQQLNACRQKPSDIYRLLTVSQWPSPGGSQDTGKTLSLILQPFTVRETSAQTMWFSDPIDDPDAVWSGIFDMTITTSNCPPGTSSYRCRNQYSTSSKTISTLHRYNNSRTFEDSAEKVIFYLPHRRIEHASVAAYNGYLFYLRYNTRLLVKFDVHLNATVTKQDLPTDIGIGDTYSYTSGARSSVNLEVDESGLWMIYSTSGNQGLVVLSKVNTTSLEIEETWYGNFPKKYMGNCFVISGVMFCLSSHNSHNAKVNYYLDTNKNAEGFMNVRLDCKYGSLKSVKYNPYSQKLYAIDNGHAVVYDLIFG